MSERDVFGANWVALPALLESDVGPHEVAWRISEYVKQIGSMAQERGLKPDWATFKVFGSKEPLGIQFVLRIEATDG